MGVQVGLGVVGVWVGGDVGSILCTSMGDPIGLVNRILSADVVALISPRLETSNLLRSLGPASLKYAMAFSQSCCWFSFYGFAYRLGLASMVALLFINIIISGDSSIIRKQSLYQWEKGTY